MNHPVIFFDGVCNLCNGAVRTVIKLDSKRHFRFSSLQSDFAKTTLQPFQIDLGDPNSSKVRGGIQNNQKTKVD